MRCAPLCASLWGATRFSCWDPSVSARIFLSGSELHKTIAEWATCPEEQQSGRRQSVISEYTEVKERPVSAMLQEFAIARYSCKNTIKIGEDGVELLALFGKLRGNINHRSRK
jgi:hypothetical protein